MKRRELKKKTSTEILLGRIYPQLIQLRDSELHGNMGELDMLYKGFRIVWEGETHPIYKPNKKVDLDEIHWSSAEGCEAGGGTP